MNNMFRDGSFSFKKDSVHDIEISPGITMRTTHYSDAVARLLFIDNEGKEMKIPDGLNVYNVTGGQNKLVPRVRESFFLGWTDNYNINCDGKTIVAYFSQRQWCVMRVSSGKCSSTGEDDAGTNGCV